MAVISYQYDPNGNLYSRQTLTYVENTIQAPKASTVLMGFTAETNDVNVEGYTVHIGGKVADGILDIGTFFIP